MTAKEKALIRLAVKLIHSDDDYYGGMNILWKLIGEKPLELGGLKETSIKEIHNGPIQGFQHPFDEDEEERPKVGFNYTNKQQ